MDPDYVPEPIYPEYIPLEDEHELPAEEQSLPPVDSPTAESLGYVTKSDPEEDPEECEDDETEDGQGGGMEEHLALADSAIVVPIDEPVFPPEGTEPVIPPPSTDITIGARYLPSGASGFSISLPPKAEVERLLAMTTPSPSPPSAGERLARCTALPAHSTTTTLPSPLLPSSGCPTQIQTLRIASTQALIDVVTAVLPLPNKIPTLPPSLYHSTTWLNNMDEFPELSMPPRQEGDRMTYWRTVWDGGGGRPMLSQEAWVIRIGLRQVQETRFQMQQAELAVLRETDRRRQAQMLEESRQPGPEARDSRSQDASRVCLTVTSIDLCYFILARQIMAPTTRERGPNTPVNPTPTPNNKHGSESICNDWTSLFRNSTNGDGKATGTEGCRSDKNLGPEAYAIELGRVLKKRRRTTYTERFQELTLICTKFVANETEKVDKYISGLPDNIYGNVKSARPKTLDETIELANDLMDQKKLTPTQKQEEK
ncbi:hypothetical protein Tco_0953756 [Tanacetum coccineum]|uniref:Reverse transcriptase domain-containing protein n=1 Tax=Tanacetum coccineum TaxID=301880 RepID=A0ABQ5E0W0_9ASTR